MSRTCSPTSALKRYIPGPKYIPNAPCMEYMPTLGWCQGGQLIGILWQSHGSSCLGYGPLPRDSTSCDIPAYPADPTRPRLATEPGRPTVQGLRSGDSPRRGATDRRTNAARQRRLERRKGSRGLSPRVSQRSFDRSGVSFRIPEPNV